MSRLLAVLAVVLAVSSVSCSRKAASKRTLAEVPSVGNDRARFLAGLPVRQTSSLYPLTQTSAWSSYAASLDSEWKNLEESQFAKVRSFEHKQLAALPKPPVLFYPFSGPDVIYADLFFPKSQIVILTGLEPVGSLDSLSRWSPDSLAPALSRWSQTVNSIFHRSFFVTREMDSQFHGRVSNGSLPLILMLLVRTGAAVDDIQLGQLDTAGRFATPPPGRKAKAVRVRYYREGDTQPRTLYYFSTDLGLGYRRDGPLARFLSTQGPFTTLVKSASFLLHWNMTAVLRSQILAQSSLILEDDTGIPYHYFRPDRWNVRLFGQYSPPDRPFRRLFQPDLAEAFHNSEKVGELGFPIGYGYRRRPSSMILAVRSAGSHDIMEAR